MVQGVGKSRVKVTRFDLPQALRSVVSVVCYLLMATQRKLSCRVFRCFSGGWLQSSVLSGSQPIASRSEEHTSELQSRPHLVCRLLLEKKKRTSRLPGSAPWFRSRPASALLL